MSAADIYIPGKNPLRTPFFRDSWGDKVPYKHYICTICPATCRPRISNDEGEWIDCDSLSMSFYEGTRIIPLNRYFSIFVVKYSRVPSAGELAAFTFEREKLKGNRSLPKVILRRCQDTINDYSNLLSKMSILTFIKNFCRSGNISDRLKMEINYYIKLDRWVME